MKRGKGILAILPVLLAFGSNAQAQQVRGDIAMTAERGEVSINIEANYYNSKLHIFALGRLFLNETDSYTKQASQWGSKNALTMEAAIGRFFRKGIFIAGPLAGVDSNRRPIAGGKILTKLHRHTFEYLGYAKLATNSDHDNGSRHRVLFDIMKDEKFFLRMDWKTEGKRTEHCRLGVELHRRIDRLNLPVYVEPFWSLNSKQFGVRAGIRL